MAKLEIWEVQLVKAMCATGKWDDQTVLSYFTRPTRSVNHREIGAIRSGKKFAAVHPASNEELENWLSVWPDRDEITGLSLRGDELLVKAREAMIAAVSTFNNAGMIFRSEIFIVTSVIAWTYLCHAWFRREKIDYRFFEKGVVVKTPSGEDKHWDLAKCLSHNSIPIDKNIKNNLQFLIGIRNEIEHQCTDRIDEFLSAQLQSCCINFNSCIKSMFGDQYGLEKQLSMSLQFVTFNGDQALGLKKAAKLPAKLEVHIEKFHSTLTEEEFADPRFGYRYAFVPLNVTKGKADKVVEFVKPGSDLTKTASIFLKKVEQKKFRAGDVVKAMQSEGFYGFTMHNHTMLWKSDKNFKKEGKGFGTMVANSWFWYEAWVSEVRDHCQHNAKKYMPAMFP